MRLKPQVSTDDWGTWEAIRLGLALELDRVTDNGRNAGEAYPEGGMTARLANELGVDVRELVRWGETHETRELEPA